MKDELGVCEGQDAAEDTQRCVIENNGAIAGGEVSGSEQCSVEIAGTEDMGRYVVDRGMHR